MSEQGSIPTRTTEWATDGGADKTDPGLTKSQIGWEAGDIPTRFNANWKDWNVYQWLTYLHNNHRVFDALEDFVAAMAAGAVSLVDEYDPAHCLAYMPSGHSWGKNATAMAGDGEFFYIGFDDGAIYCLPRDRSTQAWAVTVSVQVEDLSADGDALYAVAGRYCYKLNRTTGATVWASPYDHGSGEILYGVYSTGHRVFVTGTPQTTTYFNLVSLDPDDGTVIDEVSIGATGYTVTGKGLASDGKWVAMAHTKEGDGANVIMRVFDYELDNELWYFTDTYVDGADVAIADDTIILGTTHNVGSDQLFCFARRDQNNTGFATIWSHQFEAAVKRVSVDHRIIAVATEYSSAGGPDDDPYHMLIFDRRNGGLLYHGAPAGASANASGIYSDGFKVAICFSNSSSADVYIADLLQKPAHVRRVSGTDRYRTPQHQLAIVCGQG